jgi:hypothetical protein
MIIKLTVSLEVPGQGAIYSKTHTLNEDEGVYHEMILLTGSVDSAVSFGGVTTADVVFIEADQTISWRPAVTDTATILDRNRVHILVGTAMTTLLLTNTSGTNANVRLLLAGT